MNIDIAIL